MQLVVLPVGSEARQWEVKTEPPSSFFASQFEQLSTCSQTDLVSVSVTLNPVAAQVSVCKYIIHSIAVMSCSKQE